MNVNNINPFINGAQNILNMVCGDNPVLGTLFLKKTPYKTEAVTIEIGFFGDIKGEVVYTMKKDTAILIASRMMGGMPISGLDEISISAICELGNMISGNVATMFSGNGTTIDITPPVFRLDAASGDFPNISAPIVCVPLTIAGSEVFEIDLYFNEEKSS